MSGRYDWEAIKRDYEAGKLTFAQMSERYHIDMGYLHRQAKKKGWNRKTVKKSRAPRLIDNAFISKIARDKYREITEKMGDALTELDDIALIPLCNQYARMLDLELTVMTEGVTILSSKGVPYNNPNYNALLSTVKVVSALSKELGLTVTSRKRAGISPAASKPGDLLGAIDGISDEAVELDI